MWFNSGGGSSGSSSSSSSSSQNKPVNNAQPTAQANQMSPSALTPTLNVELMPTSNTAKTTGAVGESRSGSQNSTASDLRSYPSGTGNTMTTTTIHSSGGQLNEQPEKITFHLKTSIFTRRVTIDMDKMALGMIKQLAISFLNELYFQHQFPANSYIGDYMRKHFSNNDNISDLFDRLQLRRYAPEQEIFVPFNSVGDIEPESIISIEVAERAHQHNQNNENRNHSLTNQPSALSTGGQQQPQPLKISHEFKPESFILPAYCASCSTLIKGVFRQGYQCSFCKKNYCPKCKTKAETTDETCLTPIASSSSPQNVATSKELVKLVSSNNDINFASNSSAADQKSSSTSSNSSNSNNNNNNSSSSSRLEVLGVNMAKRKSASNLLLFNLANPFKSHHQAQQSGGKEDGKPSKARGSTGNLEPPLNLTNKRDAASQLQAESSRYNIGSDCCQTNATSDNNGNSLMVAQTNHMSSSHQNLFTDPNGQCARDAAVLSIADDQRLTMTADTTTGSSSGLTVFQLSGGLSSGKNHQNQLSNSANTSTQDLHLNSSPSMKRDQANHTFISMDWIQINGEPVCGVCKKVLRNNQPGYQQQAVFAPFMCKSCKLQVHAQCQNLVLTDCMSRIVESSRAAAAEASNEANFANKQEATQSKSGVMSSSSNASRDNIRLHRLAPSVKHTKRPDSTVPIIEGWLKHTTLSDEQARQHYWRLDETDITLYENDNSTRYFKAIAISKISRVLSASSLPKRVREDVLISNTLVSPKKTNSVSPPVVKSGPKSANTSPAKSPELMAQMSAMFAFELATGSMYLVQASSESEASRWLESLAAMTAKKCQQVDAIQPDEVSRRSTDAGQPANEQLEGGPQSDIKREVSSSAVNRLVDSVEKIDLSKPTQVVQPKPPSDAGDLLKQTAAINPASTNLPVENPAPAKLQQQPLVLMQRQHQHQHHHHHNQPGGHHHHGHRAGHKTYTDPNRSRLYNRPRIAIKLDPMSVPDHLIAGKYLIERDRVKGVGFEELGSGQFGKVYAAISEYKKEDAEKGLWSGVPVAIKEISKARFDLRQQAKLKNEANILSHLDHPGVIILERVHDLPDKIFIVMEQLEDDMLEMIVSTQEKRLNERITKFLTYQILEALKYLHGKNIAHCDLKPENVLLVERRSQFPQIKLCDFGFAKIIEENSFRSSLVGTPAYLAPEVVKGERYNRSVDLWSVGVIVYVSLSGEFPFNEGENIHDQISRANFMYPDQPWARISTQAKNFINSLLRVNCERRLSAYKAQMDEWLQDFQLWCDLSELEMRVNRRWVTDDADYAHWSKYAKKHNLLLPRSAIQLHEELLAD